MENTLNMDLPQPKYTHGIPNRHEEMSLFLHPWLCITQYVCKSEHECQCCSCINLCDYYMFPYVHYSASHLTVNLYISHSNILPTLFFLFLGWRCVTYSRYARTRPHNNFVIRWSSCHSRWPWAWIMLQWSFDALHCATYAPLNVTEIKLEHTKREGSVVTMEMTEDLLLKLKFEMLQNIHVCLARLLSKQVLSSPP